MKRSVVVYTALCVAACGGAQAKPEPRTSQAAHEPSPTDPSDTTGAAAQPPPAAAPVAGVRARPVDAPGHSPDPDASPDENLTAPQEISKPSEAAMGDGALGEPPGPPPPLPEGTTVLHIGDSFAGALGIELNRRFKEHGVRGILRYETSTYIPTWAWKKELDQYLWNFHPDLVLITLGANELEIPDPQMRAKTIRRLVERVGDRPCVWVAPPLWEGARDVLLPVIAENCAPCVYMSNEDIAPNLGRARDKIHPSMDARKVWADHVLDWLARHRDPNSKRPWEIRADGAGAKTAPEARAVTEAATQP